MISSYPVFNPVFSFEDADRDFELAFSATKVGQSLVASYNLQSDVHLYIYAPVAQEATVLQTQLPTIVTLTKGCKTARVVQDTKELPTGCSSAIATHTVTVYALVQPVVDFNIEILKPTKRPRLSSDKPQTEYEEMKTSDVHLINEYKVSFFDRIFFALQGLLMPQRQTKKNPLELPGNMVAS